jgi:putative DNA methylase
MRPDCSVPIPARLRSLHASHAPMKKTVPRGTSDPASARQKEGTAFSPTAAAAETVTGPKVTRCVLRHLDVENLRAPTQAESRSRQRHLPPISVYRWWARRTETVSGALVEAVNRDLPGRLLIADPFAGGGVIALAALLRGHQVYAQDVNPWAAQSLSTMLSLPDHSEISAAGERMRKALIDTLDRAYGTLHEDGSPAEVAHTLRVATGPCPKCRAHLRLFPTATVSLRTRIDAGGDEGFVACKGGHLHLASTLKRTSCKTCGRRVEPRALYTAGRTVSCLSCGWTGKSTEVAGQHGFGWEPVLVERVSPGRREISLPSPAELDQAGDGAWHPKLALPSIYPGIETSVLTRHGLRTWHDLYPARQRVVLEGLLGQCTIAANGDMSVAAALRSAVIGAAEMAGHASRWDSRYLKAYEVVANHRFSFTTLAVEPNVWGAGYVGRGTVERRLEHLEKASLWLEEQIGGRLTVEGPRSSLDRRASLRAGTHARVVAGGSQRLVIRTGTLDAIVTDPPYHDDVQYGELSDVFRAWAGVGTGPLDGDAIVQRGEGCSTTANYEAMLTAVFIEARRALRPDGHLIMSYANRSPAAWVALLGALQNAGFRSAGYSVVHSENEIDHAKVGKRACTLDVLLDLVPDSVTRVCRFRPSGDSSGAEESFCRVVGGYTLKIGSLRDGWQDQLTRDLRMCSFLGSGSVSTKGRG